MEGLLISLKINTGKPFVNLGHFKRKKGKNAACITTSLLDNFSYALITVHNLRCFYNLYTYHHIILAFQKSYLYIALENPRGKEHYYHPIQVGNRETK